jgi:hypothetical protein
MRLSVLAKAMLIAAMIGVVPPLPAQAATIEQTQAVATASRLRPWFNASEAQAVAMALMLPADSRFSPALAEQLVPGWQRLRQRLQKLQVSELNRQGPAHQAFRRFDLFARQVRQGMPPVPAIGTFSTERYRSRVAMFAGQQSLPWPGLPDRMVSFTNRLMGHPDNQLADVCNYLKAHYTALGLPVEEQTFDWQGKPYRNVIVTIPGESDETVLLVDHIDVAATWDYPAESLQELSAYGLGSDTIAAIRRTHVSKAPAPGANDNASASAALMEAGDLFARKRPARTIKLLHLNGEEFPGDCAGARHYVAEAMKRQEKIAAVIVMDMIGVNRQRDRVFQISAGRHPQSLALADMALNAAGTYAKGLKPQVRSSEAPLSYLYNTDGIIFSLAGYPVILLNEHLNHDEDLNRLGYHDEFDRPELMNWDYARSIASVGLATALQAASAKGGAAVDMGQRVVLQDGTARVSEFQIELAISPLFEAMLAAEKKLGRPVTDVELQALLDDDRKLDGDVAAGEESVVNRVSHWFAESGMAPISDTAIMDEVRYLRNRRLLGLP